MAERYHEGQSEEFKKGFQLADRVKQIAKGHHLDGRVALERFVSESILWALQEVSAVDFMTKGGLLHDQRLRPTGDADILYFSPRTANAIYTDVGRAATLLRKYGILWSPGEVKAMSMGGRGNGFRVPVFAKLGSTRVDTHLDISFGDLPAGAVRREFKSMFKGPSFMAWAQPIEAQAADKLAAIITLGMPNTRLKDYRDLYMLRFQGLDDSQIARHLHATMRERRADMSLLLGIPAGLSFEYVDEHQWDWKAHNPGKPDFLTVVCSLRHWHSDIMGRFHDLAAADALEPHMTARSPSIEPSVGNVISMAAYRPRLRA